MKTNLSARFWCVLTLFSLVGQVAWVVENMYFNVFIYNMFSASADDISFMVAASAVAATLTTVFMGALSDRVGKRKLFIVLGYILWGVSIFSFTLVRADVINKMFPMAVSSASIGISLTIFLDCLMTFFGSSANDAAFNAWLTDSTDSTNRGAAEGINSMMPLVSILVVFGGFMFFDLKEENSWTAIFSIIGIVVMAIGVLGAFLIKDPDIKPTRTNYLSNIIYGFRLSTVKQNPILYILLFVFALFNISIQVFMPYLIIYYEKSLGMTGYVFIMAPAIVLASVFTAFWGKVYDKRGFPFALGVSLGSLCVGYVLLFFFKSTALVFLGSLFMMCGYLASVAVFGAAIRDHTPAGKAGRLQGVRICNHVLIPGVVGARIGAFVLRDADKVLNSDGTSSFLPNEKIFAAALAVIVIIIPAVVYLCKKTKPHLLSLTTPYESEMPEIPHSTYPRPSLVRESYMCLNGKWDLRIEKGSKVKYDGEILVPFPVESRLSGVEREVGARDVLIYERNFTLSPEFMKKRLLLHFGAVDQACTVLVNGKYAGENMGGYIPFELDITDASVIGENILTVVVTDPLDRELPYGKQSKKRGGMWYTPTSGIWQTVWLESVSDNYITRLEITPTLACATVKVHGCKGKKTAVFEGKEIEFESDTVTLTPENCELWTPESPKLYEFEIIGEEDRVRSYFALRTIETKENKILLNGKPYFFHGLLSQGYYSDGIFTPATEQGYLDDILEMKALGFNMLRVHIKVEAELFYYYCDKYGMAVFQDLVNSGKYSFLIDTALPTVGIKRGIKHRASARRREHFEDAAAKTLSHLYSHPCVLYYTLFNEGWGQYDAARLYKKFKEIEPTRVWDATSGWFCEGESDVVSEHIYFKPIKLQEQKKPLVLSEFGGYSMKVDGHSANEKNTYGYKNCYDREAFAEDLEKLYLIEVKTAIKDAGLCAAVLTQVSDVEDETNGLFTYDRQVLKVDVDRMMKISSELQAAYIEYVEVNG